MQVGRVEGEEQRRARGYNSKKDGIHPHLHRWFILIYIYMGIVWARLWHQERRILFPSFYSYLPPSLPPYLPIGRLDIYALIDIARALAVTDQDDAVGLGDLVGGRTLYEREGGREREVQSDRVVKQQLLQNAPAAFSP